MNSVLPKIAASPKKPLQLRPDDVEHIIRVDLPGGWNIDSKSDVIRNNAFLFFYDVQEANTILTLHYRFKYLKTIIPLAELKKFASQIDKVRENYLEYPISHFPKSLPFYPNRGLIAFCICLIILFAIVGYVIYYKAKSSVPVGQMPLPLGGWIIIVILGLLASVYQQIKTIIDDKHLDLNTWDFYSARQSSTFFKVILGAKVFTEMYILCFAVFCIFLIHKQRDILPKVISIYFASSAILMTILHILFSKLYGDHPDSIFDLTYVIVSSFIGMYYFRTSERVKSTFVTKVTSD